jgi:N-acetyl-anhydromuramyl-L-alanine amidase AmpD
MTATFIQAHKRRYRSRRGQPVVGGVIHWVGGPQEPRDIAAAFATDKAAESYHATFGKEGQAVQHVDHRFAAHHAGGAMNVFPGDQESKEGIVNGRTLGLALCSRGFTVQPRPGSVRKAYPPKFYEARYFEPFTGAQMDELRDYIMRARREFPTFVWLTGHDDVNVGKSDPGPLFDWAWLCKAVELPRFRCEFAKDGKIWRRRWYFEHAPAPAQLPKQSLVSKVWCALPGGKGPSSDIVKIA